MEDANLNPEPITFLVLSDLHFGSLSMSKEFAPPGASPPGMMSGAVSMKDSLVQVAEKENISSILVSGDLTSDGSPQEFVGSISALSEIAERLNVNPSSVIYTYGNHDVDWRISDIPAESSPTDLKKLYLKIGASVGEIVMPGCSYGDKGPVPGCGLVENENFRIYVVNSGYYCSRDQSYRHGKLGEEQRTWLSRHLGQALDGDKWNILLLHHHPFNYPYPFQVEDISCLEEGALLMDIIGKSGLDFVCHGHRHHPMLFTDMRTGWVSPITLFCAGSLAVNERYRCAGQIPNLFHIVSLEKRLESGAAVGRVRSFEYFNAVGWRAVRYDVYVPLDPVQRFADVYDLERRKKDMVRIIDSCISKSNDPVFVLPEYEDLPLSLQCMPLRDLNDMLKTHLSGPQGKFQIGGEYPNSIVVRRLPNA